MSEIDREIDTNRQIDTGIKYHLLQIDTTHFSQTWNVKLFQYSSHEEVEMGTEKLRDSKEEDIMRILKDIQHVSKFPPLIRYSTVCIYHISLIHLFTDGPLGCFHLVFVVNYTAVKMSVQISAQSLFWVYNKQNS